MDGDRYPVDVLTEILRRLPPISGRRCLCLVCRHWQDTIDDRDNPERQHKSTKPLIYCMCKHGFPSTYVTSMTYATVAAMAAATASSSWRTSSCASRHRFRLVCRRWRDLLDERTPRIHARAKPLAFFTRGRHAAQPGSSAYVYDDDLSGEFVCCRQVWCGGAAVAAGLIMFGCRNGILAMLDERTGDITLANPATGETLAVPPPPRLPRNCAFHRTAVGFGYHPTTGRYKVVHLPVRGEASAFGVVEVFTLRGSNATWREVVAAPPPAGSSCDVDCGLVSVDGAMYWIAMGGGAAAIMSFDLEHERVAHVTSLPAMARRKLAAGRCCHLTVSGGAGIKT
ncbi:Os12g0494500 [Oryza sativa Japonica Group]|uniref:Os12g0494500 protein n=1 Tax=Oryza sativa subsp. japonica TaxID=39947 RepID=A0A0P0YAA2_ORYSJ|nr:Os12g0494500 [Oryza sativa Japonica Group]